MADIWQSHLGLAVKQQLEGTTLCAFNPNVDVVLHIDGPSIKALMQNNPDLDIEKIKATSVDNLRAINSREDFVAVLVDRLQSGKSLLMVGEDPALFSWLEKQFPNREGKPGGQAAIMANQMATLDTRSVMYSPILSPEQVEVIDKRVLFPVEEGETLSLKPIREAARPGDPTRSPWVLEYVKGEEFDFGFIKIKTPRANRVIVTRRVPGVGMNYLPEFYPYLQEFAKSIDVAFVAGYHLGGPNPNDPADMRQYFVDSAQALRVMRQGNPDVKIHFEYCPMKDPDLEREMLKTVGPELNSFGINETEIRQVLALFGLDQLATEIRENERAYVLYQAALALLNELGVERFHVHNLGYYVLVLKKPYSVSPERIRQACLYGTSVNARKALHGRYVVAEEVPEAAEMALSDVGLKQLELFAAEAAEKNPDAKGLSEFTNTGILEMDDHFVVVVPSHIVPKPVVTVGMGDTISASSYSAEVIGR